MNFTARDIMQTHVITVGINDPLMSVYRLFADEEISGAPVINERSEVEGVITIRDLLRDQQEKEEPNRDENTFYLGELAEEAFDLQMGEKDFFDMLMSRTAGDVMSQGVISVGPDTPVAKIAETLIVNRIHRVLVLGDTPDGQCLMGIITLFNLVELLA
jgi:CBS domain-containing protein